MRWTCGVERSRITRVGTVGDPGAGSESSVGMARLGGAGVIGAAAIVTVENPTEPSSSVDAKGPQKSPQKKDMAPAP